MHINIVGLGYIGLPTALMLASNGIKVTGTDINENVVAELEKGTIGFKEDNLQQIFEVALVNEIAFSSTLQETDFYIVAVPTPYLKGNKKMDPSYVVDAIGSILRVCKAESVIIIESTVSPGTIDKHIRPLIKECEKKKVSVVHAPERITPGKMVEELTRNPRVIGADDIETGEKVRKIYKTFCTGEIVLTDIKTAEMCKVIENTYRDVNIAFANELAKICREEELDVYEIIKIANMHPRVSILQPGPGVGGHCISIDPWFLVGDYPGLANIILAARKINDSMPEHVLKRISEIMEEHCIEDISKVGIYGLSYKEDVDDIRESPTLQLIECMKTHLAKGIKVYDPFINYTAVPNQYFDFDMFLNDIDVLVVMVAHSHLNENLELIKNKLIFDTKNLLNNNRGNYIKVYNL